MNKTTINLSGILALLLLFSTQTMSKNPVSAQQGISFSQSTYQQSLEQAKENDQMVFMVFHAEWCGVCTKLKKNTLPDQEVGKVYNQNFINLSVDIEKGEGEKLKERFGVKRFPTMLFVNANGEVIEESRGFKSPEKMIKIAQNVLTQ